MARGIMEAIEACDRTGSLILCSQFAPSAWHAKLGNGAIADADIDRVVYKSHTIRIEGDEFMRKRMGGSDSASKRRGGSTPPLSYRPLVELLSSERTRFIGASWIAYR